MANPRGGFSSAKIPNLWKLLLAILYNSQLQSLPFKYIKRELSRVSDLVSTELVTSITTIEVVLDV